MMRITRSSSDPLHLETSPLQVNLSSIPKTSSPPTLASKKRDVTSPVEVTTDDKAVDAPAPALKASKTTDEAKTTDSAAPTAPVSTIEDVDGDDHSTVSNLTTSTFMTHDASLRSMWTKPKASFADPVERMAPPFQDVVKPEPVKDRPIPSQSQGKPKSKFDRAALPGPTSFCQTYRQSQVCSYS